MISPISNFRYNTYKFAQQAQKKPEFTPAKLVQSGVCSPIYFTSNFNKAQITYVAGHPNPDTDSVACAIACAYLENELAKGKPGRNKYVPVAAGDLNSETKFVLKRFGFDPSKLKVSEDFETKIMEITNPCIRNKAFLYEDSPIEKFGDMFAKRGIKSVPVIEKSTKKLAGVVSGRDLTEFLFSRQGGSSPCESYNTPVKDIMTKNVETVDANAMVRNVADDIHDKTHAIYPVMKNGHFIGTVSKDDIKNPPEKTFFMVDCSTKNQFAKGVRNIIGIIDHHEHDFKPDGIIDETYKKVGACATLVTKRFKANEVPIPRDIAGILLSAIISDTDLFTSCTTTDEDIDVAKKLAKSIGVTDINAFGMEVLLSGEEDLKRMTTMEAINYDSKTYSPGGKTIMVSQIKSCEPEVYFKKFNDIYKKLGAIDSRAGIDGAIVLLTDKLNKTSRVYASSEFAALATKFAENSSNRALNEETIGGKTMKEAIESLTKGADIKIPPVFEDTSSRKEQVQPFINKICRAE